MDDVFETVSTRHRFTILNLREMDGEELLASDDWADNEWALLTKADRERVIRVVFGKLRTLTGTEQQAAASTFAVMGGILGIEEELKRRLQSEMIDLMENKIIGPAIRQGIERTVFRQLEKRFGPLPDWALEKLHTAGPDLLDEWALRVSDAKSVEEIFSL